MRNETDESFPVAYVTPDEPPDVEELRLGVALHIHSTANSAPCEHTLSETICRIPSARAVG
jgi:hypothetical protein